MTLCQAQGQSTQNDLFAMPSAWQGLYTPRARRTDPASSHRAAAKSVQFAGSHSTRILQALRTHGAMSPAQLFDHTGLSIVQCDRRRKELIDAGAVRIQLGESGKPVTHAGCEVWELAA